MTTQIPLSLRAPYQPSTFVLLLGGAAGLARRFWTAMKHRHDAAMLAGLDERMLSDIGLTRSDVRDAFAEPLWQDPTSILAARAAERRRHRRQRPFGLGTRMMSPPIAPQAGYSVPETGRPARYTL